MVAGAAAYCRRDMAETEGSAIGPAVLENWALGYLERFASSAENLRRVLQRRVRRRTSDTETVQRTAALIDELVERYRKSGIIDDAAYAAARARGRLARGEPLRRVAAGLAAKGVAAEDRAAALDALRETAPDPDLAAACAFARRRRLALPHQLRHRLRVRIGAPLQRGDDARAVRRRTVLAQLELALEPADRDLDPDDAVQHRLH